MESIQSTTYSIYFHEEGYQKLNEYLQQTKYSSLFILVDENIRAHCLPYFLEQVVVGPQVIEIKSGEENKNVDTCTFIWEELTKLGADRNSLLINLGGGVITDIGGFSAAAFKRGIKFINIPTTLLGMVDAAVGGKTGIDLGSLKNQIGVFVDPELLLVDTFFLKTLPDIEKISAYAEIIKYGLTYDIQIWKHILENDNYDLPWLIHRSIDIKNEIVLADFKEKHLRKVLNFGHTIGHAIESYFLSADDKENLTHGQAIAAGMITETYISNKLLNFPMDKLTEIKNTIQKIFGKVVIEEVDYKKVLGLLKHDKKNASGEINFVLLENIEAYEIDRKVENTLIIEALEYLNS